MNETAVDLLATAISAATFEVDNTGRAVARAVWEILTRGEPVPVEAIAGLAGVEPASVSERLDSWPGVFRDGQRRVVGFAGLALSEMAHRFQAEGGAPVFAWCALDPMLIVPILGRAARVDSKDPVTEEPISMTVTTGGVIEVAPVETVMSVLVPDRPFDDGVIQSFCNFVHYFASRETGERWIDGRPGFELVGIDEAFEIGRRAWRAFVQ